MNQSEYVYSAEELQFCVNNAIAIMLQELGKQGLLTKTPDEISNTYALILPRRNSISRAWDSIFNKDDKSRRWIVVKKT